MRRLALLLLAALAVVPTASAATPKSAVFGLRAVGNPKLGYFVYPLTPGTTRTGAVIVSNVGTVAGTVKLYAADGTTGPTTGTVYKTDKPATETGTWVSLAHSTLTLAPGGHRQVAFTVHVPANAQAGEWVAGIVAENSHKQAQQKSGKASVQIKVRDLTIVAVEVNVPGAPVISFKIGAVVAGGAAGFQKVLVHITNTGNVLAKPRGKVTIYDKSGKAIQTLPFAMDTFLPHTSIDYPVLLKKALPAGSYRAGVQMTIPGVEGASTKVVSAQPKFSVSSAQVKQVFSSTTPTQAPPAGSTSSSSSGLPTWAYAAIAAGAVVLLLLIVLLLVRARRRRTRRVPPTTLVRPEPSLPAAPAVAPVPAPEPQPLPGFAPPPPPPPPAPEQAAAGGRPASCSPYHYWEVAYDRGVLGADGVWRFPHRCRECGLELLARDIEDASAQADDTGR